MGKDTKIEWCDHTFNPWIGCAKVSPGCLNCYAETLMDKRLNQVNWGKGKPRKRTSAANWKKPLEWNAEYLRQNPEPYSGMPARPRVFVASLADWLDPEVPVEWLADLLDLIRRCPHLDLLLLTKRPELWRERMLAVLNSFEGKRVTDDQWATMRMVGDWLNGNLPHNVWIGTSVEDQKRADERIPHLLKIPARVRFLSCEPLLGPVVFNRITQEDNLGIATQVWPLHGKASLDWVITGGESGPNARPMHPDWARSLRDQCKEAGVAFFMKQMGGTRKPFPDIPEDLMVRQFPEKEAHP